MPIAIGNRVTEKDIRDWLQSQGFYGRSAKIANLELHAIQRPGWIQVYRFCLRAKSLPKRESHQAPQVTENDDWHDRFGVVLDDERNRSQESRTQIWIFEAEEDQQQKLNLLSEGLLTCRQGQNGELIWVVAGLIVFLATATIVLNLFQ